MGSSASSAPAATSGAGPARLIPRPDEPLPTGADKVVAVRAMFDTIAPNYDKVNRIMTGRLDVRWRRTTVDALGLAPASLVADLAAGTGDLVYELQRHGMDAVGVDLSMGMLAAAPTPFPRVQGDALSLPFPDGSLDGVTCGFALRNFESLPRFLDELARVLRPGGRIGLLEVGQPSNPVLGKGYDVYFGKVVPFIGGLFSDADAYAYLPRSVEYLPNPGDTLALIAAAGFDRAHHRQLSGGIAQLFTATRHRR
ncbi:MAG: ubiquinone/menaquinone biosynthesis methyltransferase [Microthrixaceae bacterium]